MPTGLTAPIYDGKDITFEQFAMRMARGLAILARFREDDFDGGLPDVVKPSEYRAGAVQSSRREMDRLRMLTPEQKRAECDAYYDKIQRQHDDAVAKATALRGRYEEMLAKVRAWEPPTEDHEYLKRFMIEQLEESIRFDCSYTSKDAPKRKPVGEWWDDQVAYAKREYKHHVKAFAEEVQQCDKITAWIQDLKTSLGMTVSA